MKDVLIQYAELKLQSQEIEKQLKDLQPAVLAIVEKEETKETPLGKFILKRNTSWVYSAKVDKMKEDLKIKQIEEQEKGIATATISTTVQFNATKI